MKIVRTKALLRIKLFIGGLTNLYQRSLDGKKWRLHFLPCRIRLIATSLL